MFKRSTVFVVLACVIGGIIYSLHHLKDTKTADPDAEAYPTVDDGGSWSPGGAQNNPTFGYFKTHFQDESQFIVETIVLDLAEMTCFARDGKVPDGRELSVAAVETSASTFRAPVYDLAITLQAGQAPLKLTLKLADPIWSPEAYAEIVAALFQQAGFKPAAAAAKPVTDWPLLEELTDASAPIIEQANLKISAQLQTDFRNPELHEQAALLLAAFALNECSGDFYDIRLPLCRLTAHLALAHALAPHSTGIYARVADAALDTLMNRQTAALEKLSEHELSDSHCTAWVRALKAWNTRDYRELDAVKSPSGLERVAWFEAYGRSVDVDLAFQKLPRTEVARIPNYCRTANTIGYSVGLGHLLLQLSLGLELRDVAAVYELACGKKLTNDNLADELNRLPERCFSSGRKPKVCVIGWGQWAMLYQRQLCHAIQENFNFLNYKWGVHDEARTFSKKCDQTFGKLRLYPFVRRFNSTEVAAYHRAVDDAYLVTVATPHLVSPQIWNTLCYKLDFAPLYQPNPNPHINEWHKHNPPPGTAYFPYPRMNQPSLVGRPDTIAQMEKLHELAPYDSTIAYNLIRLKYSGHATPEQATEVYRPVLDFSAQALVRIADTARDQPARYEELMAKAGALDPDNYLTLGDFLIPINETKAANYLAKGSALVVDTVRTASYSDWLIRYYLRHNETEKARKLADLAGEVYSYEGLEAKAGFLEATGDSAGAFDWYQKIEERYGSSTPLILFCTRHKAKTGETRYDTELQERLGKIFPSGLSTAKLTDFHGAPTDGVLIAEENELTTQAGLNRGDIIVAAQTIRVHNMEQYSYARETSAEAQLKLIVWKATAGSYREIFASPPNHRFNVNFVTYPVR